MTFEELFVLGYSLPIEWDIIDDNFIDANGKFVKTEDVVNTLNEIIINWGKQSDE